MKQLFLILFFAALNASLVAQLPIALFAENDPAQAAILTFLRSDTSLSVDLISDFEDLPRLNQYEVVVFAHPKAISFSPQARLNFESFVNAGKGFVGLSGAALLNAQWDFYDQLVGAQADSLLPIAVDSLSQNAYHPVTEGFPEKWLLYEAWPAYREQNPDNIPLYDRHIWYQNLSPSGDSARSIFIGMGADSSSYQNNPLFQQLFLNAIHWAGGELPNPSPYPPQIIVKQPESSQVYEDYPAKVKWKLDYVETLQSGVVDSLAIYVDDQLIYETNERETAGNFFIKEGGLFRVKFEAHTDNGNWVAEIVSVGVNPDPGLGLSISVPRRDRYGLGENIPITISLRNDSAIIEDIELYANDFLLASSNVAPLGYSWLAEESGTYLLKAMAQDTSGLTGVDSLFIIIEEAPQIRINLGIDAPSLLDGKPFQADTFSTERIANPFLNVKGTEWDLLYQYAAVGEELRYQLPLPNGEYRVHLHFAELEPLPTERRVSVWLEGEPYLLEQSIGLNASVYSFDVGVLDSELEILLNGTPEALLSGIEVLPKGNLPLAVTQLGPVEQAFLFAYPNPVDEDLQVYLKSAQNGVVELKLTTLTGEPVQRWELVKTEELMGDTLKIENVPPGAYLLRAQMAGVEWAGIRIVKW